MAELSRFYGIVVAIFFRSEYGRHNLPHIHVIYSEHAASVDLRGRVLAGKLPKRVERMVREWTSEHERELQDAWDQTQRGARPRKIAPLP